MYKRQVNTNNTLKQKDLAVIKLFREYLKAGYYPYYNDMPNDTAFYQTLRQSIEATIDSDLLSIYPNLNGNTARKLKILTNAISTSVPYQPNYSSLKSLVDIRDDRTLKEYLAMQTKCHLSVLIHEQAKKYGERDALTFRSFGSLEWKTVSWNQFSLRVKQVSNALLNLGVKPQENIAVFAQNCIQYLYTDFGAYGVRVVSIPFYLSLIHI